MENSTIDPAEIAEAFKPPPNEIPVPNGHFMSIKVRRFGAFLIDGTILYLVGAAAAHILLWMDVQYDQTIVWMGYVAALFSLVGQTVYYGECQTIGLATVNLKIVDESLNRPTLMAIAIRYGILLPTIFFSSSPMISTPGDLTTSFIFLPIGLVSMLCMIGNLYLALFNQSNGQYFHDTLLATHCVPTKSDAPQAIREMWKHHNLIWILFLLCFVGPPLSFFFGTGESPFNETRAVKRAEKKVESYLETTWGINFPAVYVSGTTANVSVDFFSFKSREEMMGIVDQIARHTIQQFDGVSGVEFIDIRWETSLNLFTYRKYSSGNIELTPDDWNDLLKDMNEDAFASRIEYEDNDVVSNLLNMRQL